MFKNATLKKRLMTVGVLLTAVPVLVLAVSTLVLNREMADAAADGSRTLAYTDLDHIAQGTYAMCTAQQELLEKKLQGDLNVARSILEAAGPVALGSEQVHWEATNQSTQQTSRVLLQKMMLRDQWVGQNADPKQPSPVVDRVRDLVGGTCTLFQRMNSAGDLLRVCTNVPTSAGGRAIGTYIPAVEPTGQPNPVVAAVLHGSTYTGRAFVANAWYITAYVPVFDAQKEVIGALYVGIPQESVTSLRKQILATKVGQTGYVYVLDSKGNYVISLGGKRDGENIWEAKDADGKLFIQEIVSKAKQLRPGEIAEQQYPWKNQGDTTARAKVARIMYFAPWDWVIGVGSYIDEFEGSVRRVQALGKTAEITFLGVAIGSLGAAVLVWFLVSRGLAGRIMRLVSVLSEGSQKTASAAAQVSAASQSLAQGAGEQAAAIEETTASVEEMASMTRQNAANANEAKSLAASTNGSAERGGQAMVKMSRAIDEIKKSSDSTAKIVKTIDEIAFQTNLLALNAAVEAARAGEAGKGFAVVAEEVRNLAQRSAEAAKNTASMIEESVKNADNGVLISKEVGAALTEIGEAARKMNNLVGEIAAASNEQAQGIGQISKAVGQMDQVTQQNAANAEESASASQELSAQANELNRMVQDLMALVGGAGMETGATGASSAGKTHELHRVRDAAPAPATAAGVRKAAAKPTIEQHMPGGVAGPARRRMAEGEPSAEEQIPLDEDKELARF